MERSALHLDHWPRCLPACSLTLFTTLYCSLLLSCCYAADFPFLKSAVAEAQPASLRAHLWQWRVPFGAAVCLTWHREASVWVEPSPIAPQLSKLCHINPVQCHDPFNLPLAVQMERFLQNLSFAIFSVNYVLVSKSVMSTLFYNHLTLFRCWISVVFLSLSLNCKSVSILFLTCIFMSVYYTCM